jgi:hypothetical protein
MSTITAPTRPVLPTAPYLRYLTNAQLDAARPIATAHCRQSLESSARSGAFRLLCAIVREQHHRDCVRLRQ